MDCCFGWLEFYCGKNKVRESIVSCIYELKSGKQAKDSACFWHVLVIYGAKESGERSVKSSV